MPIRKVTTHYLSTKDKALVLCRSLMNKIEKKSNEDTFINIKIRLLYLKTRLIYDNNYTQKFITRFYDLCSELNEMLDWPKIDPEDIKDIEKRFDLLVDFNTEPVLNSADFYSEQIHKLEAEILDYKKKLGEQKSDNNEKILELQASIETLTKEKETVEKQNEAINNWKTKITDAFKGLEGPLNRLVDEHKRLEWLYNVYKWSSATLVFFLIIIEIVVYVKIVCSDTYPTWDQYLPMALPVPITLGLLWGFITQMNRAQRQMVVLS